MREDIPRLKLDDLRERWPGVFVDARYVDVGVGWLPTIEEFLASGVEVVVELKEKFGGLRIDCFNDRVDVALAKILAEERSQHRCEVCGAQGYIRRPPTGWTWRQCRCDEHCTPDQLAWPRHPAVDVQSMRQTGGRWYQYDVTADALVEVEPPERWRSQE